MMLPDIPHIPACWSLIFIGLHFLLLLFILCRRDRDPMSTAFWLVLVGTVPVFGFVLYLFFGMSGSLHMQRSMAKIHRHMRNRHGRRRLLGEAIERQDRAIGRFVEAMSDEWICSSSGRRSMLLGRLFPDSPLLGGNRTELLEDGTQAYPRMIADIRRARVSIRLQSFILMNDRAGDEFLKVLAEKAAEGVDVKVLFDSFGSFWAIFSGGFRQLRKKRGKHVSIRAFSPINLLAPWLFQMRNHRKLLVIDGRIAYSGGINISEENEHSSKVPANRFIHDLHCRIEGPAVSQFALSFFRDWVCTVRHRPREIIVPGELALPEAAGTDRLRVLPGGPGCSYEGPMKLFFAAAMEAQKTLTILTPYFVPGPAYIQLLCMTAARGVRVRIVVPKNNNHKFVDYAARSSYLKLLEAGVEIYEKRGSFSHIKALLADNEWGFMGSSNCDSRSFRLNYELDFWFESGPLAEAMQRKIAEEMAECDPVQWRDAAGKNPVRRVAENFCSLLTPIL